jgi:hypothetical protein
MNSLDENYNQAIEMLKKGRSKEEVLLKFAEAKNELAPLLEISAALLSVPKNIVPTPLMRRKYAEAKVKTIWLAWLHVSKFAAVSASAMLLVSAFSVTAYEASKSTPGNLLFALKQGEENLRLVLASSQNQKASLQVAIAQQRLDEAKQVFSDPGSNQQEQSAALAALSNQTASAIAQVNTVAAADPKSDINHPLLNSLENITSQQKTLLSQIKPDSQIKLAASSALAALNSNTAKISQIKQSIAIASSNQEALAKLSADPNSIAAFGEISRATGSQITVEQITFNVTSQTVINDGLGNTLAFSDLRDGEKASVVGEKNNSLLLAQQIFVTGSASTSTASGTPEVKSAITQIANTATSTSASSTVQGAKITSGNTPSNSTSTAPDPNIDSVKTIFEDPSPQSAN